MKLPIKLWITRNENGILWLHIDKPVKKNISWSTDLCDNQKRQSTLYDYSNHKLFESVKWEDEEPTEIECYLNSVPKGQEPNRL